MNTTVAFFVVLLVAAVVALLAIAGGWQGRDLRSGPRTLEALGLDKLSREQLQRLLHEGE